MKRLLPFFASLWLIACLLLGSPAVHAQQAVLRIGDTVDIRISGVPAEEIGGFSSTQTIDDSGMLNISHIGKVKIAGMDNSQAQTLIENKLKSDKIFTNPTITLSIQANIRLVNVTGEVKSGGRLAWTADMTVMTAIGGAGGFTDFADRKNVKLVRAGKVAVLNTTKFSKDPSLDVKVLPGDQIVVPQSLW